MGLTMGGLDVRQSEVSGAIRDEHRGKQTGVEGGEGGRKESCTNELEERKKEREGEGEKKGKTDTQ